MAKKMYEIVSPTRVLRVEGLKESRAQLAYIADNLQNRGYRMETRKADTFTAVKNTSHTVTIMPVTSI